jgi:hypothetical protein
MSTKNPTDFSCPYIFKFIDNKRAWVRVENLKVTEPVTVYPFEEWETEDGRKFTLNRILYRGDFAMYWIKNDETRGIMEGPDLYTVTANINENPLVTVYNPKLIDLEACSMKLHVSLKGTTTKEGIFKIMKRCLLETHKIAIVKFTKIVDEPDNSIPDKESNESKELKK